MSLEEFLKFLENRFQTLEAISQKGKQLSTKPPHRTCSTAATRASYNETKCSACQNKYHPLYRCQAFLNQPIHKRLQHLKSNNLCINCLKPGHFANKCSSQHCTKCQHKHNTLVHNDENSYSHQVIKTVPAPSSCLTDI